MPEFSVSVITLIGFWHAGAVRGAQQGRGFFVRNVLAGVVASIAAIVAFGTAVAGGGWWVIAVVLAALGAAAASQAHRMPKP
ncbi:hypothetical protein [Methyloversatilis sp.]|uniref:hypothetical protein n=1 Tax=Methyloversatilis sp. TaxID=2569862 RepID=UPI0027344B2D|nr:hypothetical protein [Methyloversatilis sp.]MDP3579125.1 hypothetical protein [Methyloversatilis sp.]